MLSVDGTGGEADALAVGEGGVDSLTGDGIAEEAKTLGVSREGAGRQLLVAAVAVDGEVRIFAVA